MNRPYTGAPVQVGNPLEPAPPATAELRACPMPCDDDCDATCHEGHQVPWKRTHTVDSCQRPEGPEWAEWVPEGERHA